MVEKWTVDGWTPGNAPSVKNKNRSTFFNVSVDLCVSKGEKICPNDGSICHLYFPFFT